MSQELANTAPENNPNKSNRILDVFKISLPLVTAVVTALFGFIIWNAQSKIQAKIDSNNKLLEVQNQAQQAQLQALLALKEEFYKRRLTIYENACQQIVDTETALLDVGTEDESTRAMDLLSNLHKLRKGNQLYWSEQINKHLEEVWSLGIDKLVSLQSGASDDEYFKKKIEKEILDLHVQMRKDLNVLEMAKAAQEAK